MASTVSGISERKDDLDREDFFEVVDGVRVETAPMGAYAGTLASLLVSLLNAYALPRRLGWAVGEVTFDFGPQRNQRRPDVAFVPRSAEEVSCPSGDDPAAWTTVPALAVEVVSPSNTAGEIEDKVLDYFDAGVGQVWVIHPLKRRVYVYRSPTDTQVLTERDEVDCNGFLAGFRLNLADLFAAMPQLPNP